MFSFRYTAGVTHVYKEYDTFVQDGPKSSNLLFISSPNIDEFYRFILLTFGSGWLRFSKFVLCFLLVNFG